MPFAQRDDMIDTLATDRPDHSLGKGISANRHGVPAPIGVCN
jgi:hypothetical protein